MGGRIDCYLDVASFFSYVAFHDLCQNLDKLAAHGVDVEFHPVLIAGINDLSGNTPPWKLKAKSNYLAIDSQRARERVGLDGLAFPKDFMSMALTVSPQRALHYIKANYPSSTFIAAMAYLNQQMWTPPHVNLTQDENLRRVLLEATATAAGGKGEKKLFTEKQVDEIMVGRGEMKGILKAKTEEVVQLGAFGAPWMWVTNAKGESSPFFGSDRFNHIYKHLDIPFQDVEILPPSKASKL